ncbi:hypothetical protein GN956_G4317 [Arapaima gigas]
MECKELSTVVQEKPQPSDTPPQSSSQVDHKEEDCTVGSPSPQFKDGPLEMETPTKVDASKKKDGPRSSTPTKSHGSTTTPTPGISASPQPRKGMQPLMFTKAL